MAETEDRTVKVTFEADKRGLSESLKSLNDQAEQLKTTLDKLGEVSSKNAGGSKKLDNKLSAHGVDPKSLSAVKDLVRLEEKLLTIVEDRNKALQKQASLYKKAAAAGGGGGGGGADRVGIAAMFGKGGPVTAAIMKAVGLLTGGSVTAIASQMRLGYGAYADYAGSLAGLAGTGATRKQMKGRSAAGVQYGYSPQETAEQARTLAIQTGSAMNVTQAQMLTRATTMDMSQVSGFMGTMTKAGGMDNGGRDVKKIIALGFASGIAQSRLPEYMQGVEKVVQQQGGMQGGDVNAFDYASVLQAMGAGGASGLQGARGAAVFGKLNQSIIKPGGGEAGQALMLQAMGFGRPGGNTTYYEALKKQQQGATPENVESLFRETAMQSGGAQEQGLQLGTMTGLGLSVIEKLRDALGNKSGAARKSELARILKEARPADERAADSMKEVGFHAKRIAFLQNRLVNIGALEYEAVLKLQDSVNELVDLALPPAVDLLDTVADAAHLGTDVLTGKLTKKEGAHQLKQLWGPEQFHRNDPRGLEAFRETNLDEETALQMKELIDGKAQWHHDLQNAKLSEGDLRDDKALIATLSRVLLSTLGNIDESSSILSDNTRQLILHSNFGSSGVVSQSVDAPWKGR